MNHPSNGHLVISLDFELSWGIFDAKSINSYKYNLLNVRHVIPRLIALSDIYNINISFATVGLLFAKTKEELLNAIPDIRPSYANSNYNPYKIIDSVGNFEDDDPYHYANSLIKMIANKGNHEIGSHTFSHYYCNEKGQDKSQFEEDLKANIKIAKLNKVDIKSAVFPRNQINKDYLSICSKYGIMSYRGVEKHWIHQTNSKKEQRNPVHRILRLLDCYINISGHNTYALDALNSENSIVNIPSSKFLRPYNKKFSFLEPLKVLRIKKAMTHAAKNNEVYHLWWHPHNFGKNMNKNFEVLERIFSHYKYLNQKYGFKSVTMTALAKKSSLN